MRNYLLIIPIAALVSLVANAVGDKMTITGLERVRMWTETYASEHCRVEFEFVLEPKSDELKEVTSAKTVAISGTGDCFLLSAVPPAADVPAEVQATLELPIVITQGEETCEGLATYRLAIKDAALAKEFPINSKQERFSVACSIVDHAAAHAKAKSKAGWPDTLVAFPLALEP